MRDNRTLIDLDDASGEAQVWIQRAGKPMITKTVSIDDLVAAMSKGFEITTGILPQGVKFYSGTKSHYKIGIEVPGRRRTVSFSLTTGKFDVEIPFPDMLFIFEVSRGHYQSSKGFAVIPPVGLSNDQLYLFPFGNISHNGSICWGSAATGEVTDAIMLDSAVNKFFSSVFSGHYVWGTNTFHPPEGVGDLQELINYLKDKEDFPSSMLKPCGMTLGEVLS